jgi:2-oxoisovalerate dehydrogenase E1 component beta subunit
MGFGAELAATISKECFLQLDAPVYRCCGLDTPFPNALEDEYLPDAPRVKLAILEAMEF